MKKIIIILCITFLGVSISLTYKQSEKRITYNQRQVITASYIIPNNINELEQLSPIIVKGKLTSAREKDKDPNIVGPSTISKFKVEKIYKGEIHEKVISVLEPFEIVKNDFSNIEGYIPMEENKEYILFLRENNTKKGKEYTIKFMSFGKFNTLKSSKITPQKSNIKYLEEIKNNEFISESPEVCDNYNKIKSDVLDKYLD